MSHQAKILVDECLGQPAVKALIPLLELTGIHAELAHQLDVYGQGADDQKWIPRAARWLDRYYLRPRKEEPDSSKVAVVMRSISGHTYITKRWIESATDALQMPKNPRALGGDCRSHKECPWDKISIAPYGRNILKDRFNKNTHGRQYCEGAATTWLSSARKLRP